MLTTMMIAAPTPGDVQSQLSGLKVFTVVDMKDGYWHVKLSEESSYYILLHLQHAMGQETLPSNALRKLLSKRNNAETKRGNIWRHSMSPRHC